MKVPYEAWIQDIAGWDPRPHLRTVTLPVHEVLTATPPAVDRQKPPDSESRGPIDNPRGLRGYEGGNQRTILDRFDTRNMKGRVNSPGPREVETDSSRVDDSGYRKRSNKTGCQLT